MMSPDDNEPLEQFAAVPSSMFDDENQDFQQPPPGTTDVSTVQAASSVGLGGWATGAGSALFAVTKGVSSRVEGVSSRMSLRAKDMLSSIGDDDTTGNNQSRNGGAPKSVNEQEVLRLASVLAQPVQLAEKVIAMNRLVNELGSPAGGDGGSAPEAVVAPPSVLQAAAEPLVSLLRDAEHFDAFFANACAGCAQRLVEIQGSAFAAQLVEAGATEALIPLLDPRFELTRIGILALMEALLQAERRTVCSRIVEVPRGMEALVDLLDDRWDEIRHQAISLLAAFLDQGTSGIPPPPDLQNLVAFQDGFERLLNNVNDGEASDEKTSLLALAALAGTLRDNPLSRKLFAAGGYVSRLTPLLSVSSHMHTVDLSDVIAAASSSSSHPSAAPNGSSSAADGTRGKAGSSRRRWGWGGGGGGDGRGESGQAGVTAEGGRDPITPSGGIDRLAAGDGTVSAFEDASGAGARREGGGGEGEEGGDHLIPVARINAVLALLSALVGAAPLPAAAAAAAAPVLAEDADGRSPESCKPLTCGVSSPVEPPVVAPSSTGSGTADDDVRSAVGRASGLLESICELALSGKPRAFNGASVGGAPTWAEFGLPVECQRAAMHVLVAMMDGHAVNQALFADCKIRGAPISVSVLGRTELVNGKPRSALDLLFALWLAAAREVELHQDREGEIEAAGTGDAVTEAELLDKTLGAFLRGNTPWCMRVFSAASAMHSPRAGTGTPVDRGAASPLQSPSRSPSSSFSRPHGRRGGGFLSNEHACGGLHTMLDIMSRGLLSPTMSTPLGMLGGGGAAAGAAGAAGRAARARMVTRNMNGHHHRRDHNHHHPDTNDESQYRESSAKPDEGVDRTTPGSTKNASSHHEDDDPVAAALCLHLLRRVLQAGGAEARAMAASVGISTRPRQPAGSAGVGGSRRRERDRADGASTSVSDEDPSAALHSGGRGSDGWGVAHSSAAAPNSGASIGKVGGGGAAVGGGGWRRRRAAAGDGVVGLRCGPPLTPALEVAVRLLADGYNVMVMLQNKAVNESESESRESPADLMRYIISLGELLVTWMPPAGAGPTLSRRLLSSGANWLLLRTLGRALDPATARRVNKECRWPASGFTSGSGAEFSSAYLHALVAVNLGSFFASAEGLTRGTLAAGIAKHVGVFELCRAMDSAADWVAFTRGGRKRPSPVPTWWALEGDRTFCEVMLGAIQAAQGALVEIMAGKYANPSSHHTSHAAAVVATANGVAAAGKGGRGDMNGGSTDNGCSSDGGELLRRQQLRIQELETRLLHAGGSGLTQDAREPSSSAADEYLKRGDEVSQRVAMRNGSAGHGVVVGVNGLGSAAQPQWRITI